MRKMKIAIPMLLISAATSTTAFAGVDGFYGGIAGVHSGIVIDEGANTQKQDNDMTSAGAFIGYQQHFYQNFYSAVEVFYNDTSQDKTDANAYQLNVDSQYGMKAHLGLDASWGGAIYLLAGVANLDYDVTISGEHADNSGFSPLFGIGVGYQINDYLSTNFEISAMSDDISIAGDQDKSVSLTTLRLGLAYHF